MELVATSITAYTRSDQPMDRDRGLRRVNPAQIISWNAEMESSIGGACGLTYACAIAYAESYTNLV